jgi:hypothetical protein
MGDVSDTSRAWPRLSEAICGNSFASGRVPNVASLIRTTRQALVRLGSVDTLIACGTLLAPREFARA